jgi:hypothetical protein
LFQTLQHLNNDLEKQVSVLKRQLESETLLRIDLENKNKTLREELQFNQHIYETVSDLTEVQLDRKGLLSAESPPDWIFGI